MLASLGLRCKAHPEQCAISEFAAQQCRDAAAHIDLAAGARPLPKKSMHLRRIQTGTQPPNKQVSRSPAAQNCSTSAAATPTLPSFAMSVTRTCIHGGKYNYTIEERLFTVEECYDAAEAFITSATMFVQGVVKIDQAKLNDGKVGKITQQLRELYIEMALAEVS